MDPFDGTGALARMVQRLVIFSRTMTYTTIYFILLIRSHLTLLEVLCVATSYIRYSEIISISSLLERKSCNMHTRARTYTMARLVADDALCTVKGDVTIITPRTLVPMTCDDLTRISADGNSNLLLCTT
jgi:hypothetical protein